MTDSISLYCPVQAPTDDVGQLPYSGQIGFDQDGVLGRVRGEAVRVSSPYTQAEFKIRSHVDQSRRLCGYIVELNPPACLIGHNLLLANSAYRGSVAAFELLLKWLERAGAESDALSRLSFDTVRISSVTPTFLVDCGSHESALGALKQFEDHAVAVLNGKNSLVPEGKRDPVVYSVGSGSAPTVYIKQREFQIKAYVKTNRVPAKSHREFPSKRVEELVLSKAKSYLRVEVELFGKWLNQNSLERPHEWVTTRAGEDTGADPYACVFQLVRKVLRLDEKFRHRTPRSVDLRQLGAADRDLVSAHLVGADLRTHQSVLLKGCRLQQQKYFSALRARILKRLRIDIDMPWRIQSRMLSPDLPFLLSYPGMFEPPAMLADYVFCRQNAALMSRTALVGR